jgi:NADPH:quinone reductase-like Zn-dependent oxidoreductase
MKAVCVKPDRTLEVRDIAEPSDPLAGHVLIDMEASAINHGDKTFLTAPPMNLPPTLQNVWGASGAGRVVAIGSGVPEHYLGKQVAIYRSLSRTPFTLGLWCERAQISYLSCLILPDRVSARDYSGSLVNVMTAYAFLQKVREEGHTGVVATAGNSATARALLALARHANTPTIFLIRSVAARDELQKLGAEHVLLTNDERFEAELASLAERLKATAVFDGVGGDLITRIAPRLPVNSTVYFYGFLARDAPISLPSVTFMAKNLTMKRFSNFESATVKDPLKLAAALTELERLIDDPLFRTRGGQEFGFDQIDEAMRFETAPGAKAVLVP